MEPQALPRAFSDESGCRLAKKELGFYSEVGNSKDQMMEEIKCVESV